MSTVLTFTGWSPASTAASMPSRTCSRASRRLISMNRSRRSVSSEMLIRLSPAAARSWAISRSVAPLVVRATSTPSAASRADQHGQVGPHRRLAAGEPDRFEPVALDQQPDDPLDLLVGEELLAGQPLHPSSGMQ